MRKATGNDLPSLLFFSFLLFFSPFVFPALWLWRIVNDPNSGGATARARSARVEFQSGKLSALSRFAKRTIRMDGNRSFLRVASTSLFHFFHFRLRCACFISPRSPTTEKAFCSSWSGSTWPFYERWKRVDRRRVRAFRIAGPAARTPLRDSLLDIDAYLRACCLHVNSG